MPLNKLQEHISNAAETLGFGEYDESPGEGRGNEGYCPEGPWNRCEAWRRD